MQTRFTLATVALAMLALAACDKRKADPPLPGVAASTPAVPSVSDPSVPPAATVLAPATTPTAQDAPGGRATGAMTKAQESSAMPMPGQVNNHSSTALDPVARGASKTAAVPPP